MFTKVWRKEKTATDGLVSELIYFYLNIFLHSILVI